MIFAKAVSVQDTTEKDRAMKELEEEKRLRIQAQRDEAQALLQQNLARCECDKLREEIESMKEKLVSSSSSSSVTSSEEPPLVVKCRKDGKYTLLKNIRVSQVHNYAGSIRALKHVSAYARHTLTCGNNN